MTESQKIALREMQKTFVRGEIQALTWVLGANQLQTKFRITVMHRIHQLEEFLHNPDREPDFVGDVPRAIPKFGEGEEK